MNQNQLEASEIVNLIECSILEWHKRNEYRDPEFEIVTDDIRRIRPHNKHRDSLREVISELVNTNTEMWHEEDKVRSASDQVVLKAIRNINPLNQHRNDLIEEIDEILVDSIKDGGK